MNELIKVTYDNDRPAVSARDLHDFLEVKTAYKDWFPRMCEYGFKMGEDFNPLKNERVQMEGNRYVSRTVDDAVMTIDMAKELCMIQRNEKGKLARQYFIQIEKDWNSPEKIMARALQIAKDKIMRLETKVEADRPKVLFADAVSASHTSILVGELAKLLRQNGADIGQNRLFAWLRDNGYLIRRGGTYAGWSHRATNSHFYEIKGGERNEQDRNADAAGRGAVPAGSRVEHIAGYAAAGYQAGGVSLWDRDRDGAKPGVPDLQEAAGRMDRGKDGGGMSAFAWALAFIGAAWLSWAIVKGVEALGR